MGESDEAESKGNWQLATAIANQVPLVYVVNGNDFNAIFNPASPYSIVPSEELDIKGTTVKYACYQIGRVCVTGAAPAIALAFKSGIEPQSHATGYQLPFVADHILNCVGFKGYPSDRLQFITHYHCGIPGWRSRFAEFLSSEFEHPHHYWIGCPSNTNFLYHHPKPCASMTWVWEIGLTHAVSLFDCAFWAATEEAFNAIQYLRFTQYDGNLSNSAGTLQRHAGFMNICTKTTDKSVDKVLEEELFDRWGASDGEY